MTRSISGARLTAGGLLAGTLAGTLAVAAASGAAAHPHVWVATQSQAIFENGSLTALRFTWLFDEMYTTSALEGLDTNKDGKVEGAELDELTKVNMEGLKEFEYFTTITMAGKPVAVGDPREFSMEVKAVDMAPGPQLAAGPTDTLQPSSGAGTRQEAQGLLSRLTGWMAGLFGRNSSPSSPTASNAPGQSQTPEKTQVLALHMTLPLKAPIPAGDLGREKEGFQFSTGDSQMYIWFEPTAKDGIGLAPGAPANCKAMMVEQAMDEQQKKLQEAFGRMGAAIAGPPKAVGIVCSPQ